MVDALVLRGSRPIVPIFFLFLFFFPPTSEAMARHLHLCLRFEVMSGPGEMFAQARPQRKDAPWPKDFDGVR